MTLCKSRITSFWAKAAVSYARLCPEASRCGKSCSSWRTLACAPARPQAAIAPRKWASEAVG
ncbi:Uncharacterised protein [Klebsiella pneumoniae]|nr:Uncharacterised protein [Klebsiella pneumoniae]